MMTKGELYRGFRVLDAVDLDDCSSKGIYLRHEKTGLEVFHMLNDDEENLFAFAFKTPVSDSTGVAHVIEHSVLCGSKKYPLRDPFMRMENQSVNTYLNAYTAGDHTVYPASSTVRADYFNLMSVYADAVFFPLLKKEIFLQECRHLEFDAAGNPEIQGVVYNEMKGVFSSYESIVHSAIEDAVNAGSQYQYVSGGDPLEIPSLTYDEFRAYHKKYYCTANCLVFMYGNIPTREQLDFLDEAVIKNVKSPGKRASYPPVDESAVIQKEVQARAPKSTDGKKSTVSCVWKIPAGGGDRNELEIELLFLNTLLWGNDSAPVAKALTDSGLGQDLAPQTGTDISGEFCTVSCGLRGVEKKNARKVRRTLMESLEELCRNGIDGSELDRTFMKFEFVNREICRFSGPFSLVLMRRCLRAWRYSGNPCRMLSFRRETEKLRQRIDSDPHYIPGLIRKFFIENEMTSLVTVTPSAAWSRERDERERQNAQSMLNETGIQGALDELDRMHRFQEKETAPEDEGCIPCISRTQLEPYRDTIRTGHRRISGIDVLTNQEETNGIIYVRVAFPVDCLSPRDYPLLAPLSQWFGEAGWKGVPWNEGISMIEQCTGSFGAYVETDSITAHSDDGKAYEKYVDRDWFVFEFNMLEECAERAFSLAGDCLNLTDFSDQKRLSDLRSARCNTLHSSVSSHAVHFAMTRTLCRIDTHYAANELWTGFSSVLTADSMMRMDIAALSSRLDALFRKVKKSGLLVHVTADKKGIDRTMKILPDFLAGIKAVPVKEKKPCRESEFFSMVELPGNVLRDRNAADDGTFVDELIVIPGNVGYACSTVPSMKIGTKGCVQDMVFSHYMANTELWSRIRTSGGAYGVSFREITDSSLSEFISYRDPRPFESVEEFYRVLHEAAGRTYDRDSVDRTVIGCYSDEVSPRTPAERGQLGLLRTLCGVSPRNKEKKVEWLLGMTEEDMEKSARRYAKNARNRPERCRTVILCGKEMISAKIQENTGKIIELGI